MEVRDLVKVEYLHWLCKNLSYFERRRVTWLWYNELRNILENNCWENRNVVMCFSGICLICTMLKLSFASFKECFLFFWTKSIEKKFNLQLFYIPIVSWAFILAWATHVVHCFKTCFEEMTACVIKTVLVT